MQYSVTTVNSRDIFNAIVRNVLRVQELRPKDSGFEAKSVKIGLVKHSLLKAEVYTSLDS